MAQPTLIDQGTLNRLLTQIQLPNFPGLTTPSSNMGRRQVSISFNGPATTPIPTATGMVMSPEPFIQVTINLCLLRTQGLGQAWRQQIETGTVLGPVTAYLDVRNSIEPEYSFQNCAVAHVGDIDGAGSSGEYNITITGTYPINSGLYV